MAGLAFLALAACAPGAPAPPSAPGPDPEALCGRGGWALLDRGGSLEVHCLDLWHF